MNNSRERLELEDYERIINEELEKISLFISVDEIEDNELLIAIDSDTLDSETFWKILSVVEDWIEPKSGEYDYSVRLSEGTRDTYFDTWLFKFGGFKWKSLLK